MAERWTEELPHDLEPLSEPGGNLRGRLSDGREVVARVVAIRAGEEGPRLIAHLRRLAGAGDPRLVPVLGAAREPEAVWALFEMDAGRPLRALLEGGPLPASLAAAAGIEVLGGLVALHAAGIAHGALHAGNVHVARDGRVRLGDYAVRRGRWTGGGRDVSDDDLRRDLTRAGALLCEMLGVPVRPGGGELRNAERTTPAVVAAARALAGGRVGRDAPAALETVRSAAGGLAGPHQHRRHLWALGVMAAGGDPAAEAAAHAAAAAEPVPSDPATAPPAGPAPGTAAPGGWRGLPRAWVAVLLLAALGTATVGVVLGTRAGQSGQPVVSTRVPAPTALPATAAGSPAPSAPAPTGTPAATPSPAPTPAAQAPVAGSPDAAVSSFYQFVGEHRFDAAVGLWSPRMQASYPPAENVYQRFADTTSLTLVRDQVSSPGDASAVVSVDLVEVRGGRTYHWVGSWSLVRQDAGWLLDQPSLRQG